MKISHSIFFSFLLILLLFSITTVINYTQYNRVKDNADFLARSSTIVRESNRFQRNLLNMLSAGRGFLLTRDSSFLETFNGTASENKATLGELNSLVDDVEQREQLKSISRLDQQWTNGFFDVFTGVHRRQKLLDVPFKKNRGEEQHNYLNDETDAFQSLQASLRKFINAEYERREVQKKVLAQKIQRTRKISFWLTLVSIVIGFLIAGALAFALSKRILSMVKMANSISAGNYAIQMADHKMDELSKLSFSLNHMAEVLEENFAALKRKNEELDQFAHIVSHDLKAPLRGISNVVLWIEEDHGNELSPKVHDYMHLIHGRLNRAENLINGILSYARIEKEAYEKEEVNVKVMVEEIIAEQIIPSGLRIDVDNRLPTIVTQKLPLMQVFSNLINNAIKYHNKQDGKVKIYSREFRDEYEFFVEDNGPGIAHNHHSKIFKIFQTLQERDSFESTGVGLSIVQKILDARKEKIMLRSEAGKGSVFSFTWKK
jgi:signal transduction histidine kinase